MKLRMPIGRNWHCCNRKVLLFGAQVWLGYNQSLRPAELGLTLNIDMAATAFLEVQPVLDFISRALNLRPQQLTSADPRTIKKASRAITGIKVAATLYGAS